jgi:hypothetical protein
MYIFYCILKPVSIQKLDDDFIVTIELCAVAADPVHASFLLFVVTPDSVPPVAYIPHTRRPCTGISLACA